ncbi:hypothetical protein Ac2012v2_006535 [Leucoagaricus gongylophorus]
MLTLSPRSLVHGLSCSSGGFVSNKPLALLRHVGPCLVSQEDGRPIFLSRLASKVSKDHISGCRGAAVGSLPFTKNTRVCKLTNDNCNIIKTISS